MNGRGFVVLLACAAVSAAVAIGVGFPPEVVEAPEAVPDTRTPVDGETPPNRPEERATPPSTLLVDSASTASVDTAASWDYRRTTVADLDGDGVPERLVLASDVSGHRRWGAHVGRPASLGRVRRGG